MRGIIAVGLAVLALVSMSAAAAPVLVAVDEANPPFMYENRGAAGGIYPALLQEAFKRMAEPLTIVAVPWRRAIVGIDAGENGVGGIYQNAERLKKYDYSEPLFDEVITVYAPAGQARTFAGLKSLAGRRVGVIAGWSYGDEVDQAIREKQFVVDSASGDAQNFAKLDYGRLDLVLAIQESAAAAIASLGLRNTVVALEPPLVRNRAYLAFAKSADKTALLARFNATLQSMRGDGSVDRIVAGVLVH
jgi:polar amino acid transport system substrate-binding protein